MNQPALPKETAALRQAADGARAASYPRYSGFTVLAAVQRIDGAIYAGANVEVVNYSLSKHAEEMAVLLAISDGALKLGDAWLKVVYVRGASPCGGCRQFLHEWAAPGALCIIDRPEATEVVALSELLPQPFGPSELPDRRPLQ